MSQDYIPVWASVSRSLWQITDQKSFDYCFYPSHPSSGGLNKPSLSSQLRNLVSVITSAKAPTRPNTRRNSKSTCSSSWACAALQALGRSPSEGAHRWIHTPPPSITSQYLVTCCLCSSWSSLIWCHWLFHSLLCWDKVQLIKPNTTLVRGQTVWCKNLLKLICVNCNEGLCLSGGKDELKWSFFFFSF